jgi:hypothetical protein
VAFDSHYTNGRPESVANSMWRRTRLVNDTHGSAIAKIHSAFIFTWTFWVTPQRIGTIGAWLPGGVWVGWGVPEVLAAFVTTVGVIVGASSALSASHFGERILRMVWIGAPI